jgi:Na+(H+)/acetate symporter ActP
MIRQIKKAVISILAGVILAVALSITLQAPPKTHISEGRSVKPTSQETSETMEASNKSTGQTSEGEMAVNPQQPIPTLLVIAFIVGLIVYAIAKTLVK